MTSIETPCLSPAQPAESLSYSLAKPALLFGNDPAAIARATTLLNAAGIRVAGHHTLDAAADRLDQQVALGLVWLECSDPSEAPSDALLDRLARLSSGGEAAVVATAPPSMIDLLYARLDHGSAQILIDPDDAPACRRPLARAGIGLSAFESKRCRARQCRPPAPIVGRNGAYRVDPGPPVLVA